MVDFTRYFDKKSTTCYAVGPSGLGVIQTGFGVLWRGWHKEDLGIYVEKFDLYNPRSTGFYISGSNEILTTESLSIAWDSGSRVWAGTQIGNVSTVYAFSGVAHTAYSFTGIYPQVFFNSCYVSGADRRIECYYLKPGQDKIYLRTEDDMTNEIVFHEDLIFTPTRLHQVIATDFDTRRVSIFGRYNDGSYFRMVSDVYDGLTDHCSNFENIPSGEISGFVNNNLKRKYFLYRDVTRYYDFAPYASGIISARFGEKFVDRLPRYVYDDLLQYVSGQISLLNSDHGFYRGFFVEKKNPYAYDDMLLYASGVINQLTSGTKMRTGILWQ